MTTIRVTPKNSSDEFTVFTDIPYTFELCRLLARVIELPSFRGSLLGPDVAGLCACVRRAEAEAETVLVTGHGDGDVDRAASARAQLAGDRAAWLEVAARIGTDEDAGDYRAWVAEWYGWEWMTPEEFLAICSEELGRPVDDEWGAFFDLTQRAVADALGWTEEALAAFQRERFAVQVDAELVIRPTDSLWPVKLAEIAVRDANRYKELNALNPDHLDRNGQWKPLYQGHRIRLPAAWVRPLRDAGYRIEPEDAAALRTLACGDQHLTAPHARHPERRASVRRVEIVFLDDMPATTCTRARPCPCHLYDPRWYDFEYLHVDPVDALTARFQLDHAAWRREDAPTDTVSEGDACRMQVEVTDEDGDAVRGAFALEFQVERGIGGSFVRVDAPVPREAPGGRRVVDVEWIARLSDEVGDTGAQGEPATERVRFRVRWKRRPGEKGDTKRPDDLISPVLHVKAKGPPVAVDVLPPRLFWSLNLSPGARRDHPLVSADPDPTTAVTAMVKHITDRALRGDAIEKLMDDPQYDYDQPGFDGVEEQWARTVAKHMVSLPYINTEITFGDDWVDRFLSTGHYPVSVLCQQSVTLALMMAGWNGWENRADCTCDGTSGTANKIETYAKKRSLTWLPASTARAAELKPGMVLVWGATAAELASNGVTGNVGHNAIVLREPKSPATVNGGKAADDWFQPLDTGAMSYSRAYPPGMPTGGDQDEPFLNYIRPGLGSWTGELPEVGPDGKPTGAKKTVTVNQPFLGAGQILTRFAPDKRTLRPRGIARLVIEERASKTVIYASSWISMTQAALPVSQLAFSVRGAPGVDRYEPRWQIDSEPLVKTREILDVFADPAGLAMTDTKSNKTANVRFALATQIPRHGPQITDAVMNKLEEMFFNLCPLFINPAFIGPVAAGTFFGWKKGTRLVPLVDHAPGGLSRALVWTPSTDPTAPSPCSVRELDPRNRDPLRKEVTASSFQDIRAGHSLVYMGRHGGKHHVFHYIPAGSQSSYWVWPYNPSASGKAQPLPNPHIYFGTWGSTGDGAKFTHLDGRVLLRKDQKFWLYDYTPSNASDLLPDPPGASGAWSRGDFVLNLGGGHVVAVTGANGNYLGMRYDPRIYDVKAPHTKDPLQTTVGGILPEFPSNVADVVAIGADRVLAYDESGNYWIWKYTGR